MQNLNNTENEIKHIAGKKDKEDTNPIHINPIPKQLNIEHIK